MILAIVLTLGVCVWMTLDRRGAGSGSASSAAPVMRPVDHELLTPAPGASRRQPVLATDVARFDEPAPAAAASSAPAATLVRGTLILVDDAGVEHRHEAGRFELTTWPPSAEADATDTASPAPGRRQRLRDRQVTVVEVRDGRWQARVPAHAGRRCARVVVGGHPLCDVQVVELASDPAVVELQLTGRALYPARMRVVDAASSVDLAGIRVAVVDPEDPRQHPGELAPILAGALSPIEIAAPAVARRSYLVGAPDHAWQRVEWDHLAARESVVRLEPGGALAIHVSTDVRLEDTLVTVTAHDGRGPDARARVTRDLPLRIEGIAPGAYRVDLVPASSQVRDQVASIAQVETTVVAGTTTEVLLAGRIGLRPLEVGLAGSVRMSTEWSAGGPHLVLRALGRTALWHMGTGGHLGGLVVQPEGDVWSFRSARAIAGGRYLLHERLTGFVRVIEVGPAGTADCRLEIPDPIELPIEVVDRRSGAPIEQSELLWLPPSAEAAPDPRSDLWVHATDHPGVFRVRVPAWDRLEFEARAAGFQAMRGALRPALDGNDGLRIALERP